MGKANIDPLELLLAKYGLDLKEVEEIFTGERYSGVLLKDGNIGVCSGTGRKIPVNKGEYDSLNLQAFSHRVFVNAYFNAKLNYSNSVAAEPEITKAVDFSKFKNVVMLGFIKPVAKQLKNAGVRLTIFDLNRNEPELTPITEREKHLANADAVVLSSTAIANGTFLQTIKNSKRSSKIFILGPSSTMAKEFFEFEKIEMIFGSVFKNRDRRIIEIIKNDGGTKEFLKYGIKKAISR